MEIYCAMCAPPDELPFGCPCDTGPRWKILSSFLGAAADFDVRGKMKEEGQRRGEHRECDRHSSLLRPPPHRLKWAEARESR